MTPIVEYTYHSIEQAQAAFSNLWNVKFTQPEAGELEIRFQTTAVGRCLVYQGGSNIPMICTGTRTPDVVTISPVSAKCERGKYRGQQLKAGQVLVMDPGGDAFQRIAANHQQTAVSIPVDLLDRIARSEWFSGWPPLELESRHAGTSGVQYFIPDRAINRFRKGSSLHWSKRGGAICPNDLCDDPPSISNEFRAIEAS